MAHGAGSGIRHHVRRPLHGAAHRDRHVLAARHPHAHAPQGGEILYSKPYRFLRLQSQPSTINPAAACPRPPRTSMTATVTPARQSPYLCTPQRDGLNRPALRLGHHHLHPRTLYARDPWQAMQPWLLLMACGCTECLLNAPGSAEAQSGGQLCCCGPLLCRLLSFHAGFCLWSHTAHTGK